MTAAWKILLQDIVAERRVPAALRERAAELLTPGMAGRPSKYTAEQQAEVVRLKREGLTWLQVVERTGIPFETCRVFVRREAKGD